MSAKARQLHSKGDADLRVPVREGPHLRGHAAHERRPVTGARSAARPSSACSTRRGAFQGLGLLQHRLRHPQALAREKSEGSRIVASSSPSRGLEQLDSGSLGKSKSSDSSSSRSDCKSLESSTKRPRPSKKDRPARGPPPRAVRGSAVHQLVHRPAALPGRRPSADSPSGSVVAPLGLSTSVGALPPISEAANRLQQGRAAHVGADRLGRVPGGPRQVEEGARARTAGT